MRDHSLDLSPERTQSLVPPTHAQPNQCSASRRAVSPSNSYCDTTAALIEPISPKNGNRRSFRMDACTYNLLTGKTNMPLQLRFSDGSGSNPTRIGSCPYCPLGSVEHQCSMTTTNPRHWSSLLELEGEEKMEEALSSPCASSTASSSLSSSSARIPSVSVGGITYYPEEVLAEGWLHKKGTGHDWLGSRGWKARWARLCLASTDVGDLLLPLPTHRNDPIVSTIQKQRLRPTSPEPLFKPYHIPKAPTSPIVPLLLLSWYPTSTNVSTVIVLDSTVVWPVDLEEKTRVHPYRLEVRHATSQENVSLPTLTRTFAAPQRERDAWVYAISQALLTFAKAKERARKLLELQEKQMAAKIISPRGVIGTEEEYPWSRFGSLMDRDNAVPMSKEKCASTSPPLSPTSMRRRWVSALSQEEEPPERSPPTRSNSSPSLIGIRVAAV